MSDSPTAYSGPKSGNGKSSVRRLAEAALRKGQSRPDSVSEDFWEALTVEAIKWSKSSGQDISEFGLNHDEQVSAEEAAKRHLNGEGTASQFVEAFVREKRAKRIAAATAGDVLNRQSSDYPAIAGAIPTLVPPNAFQPFADVTQATKDHDRVGEQARALAMAAQSIEPEDVPEKRKERGLPLWAQWVGWGAAIVLGIAAIIVTIVLAV